MLERNGPLSVGVVGNVISVRGSEAYVGLAANTYGREVTRPTVGKFLAVDTGANSIIGLVAEVTRRGLEDCKATGCEALARIELMGEILRSPGRAAQFRRGVGEYPTIGDPVRLMSAADLQLIYAPSSHRMIAVGHLSQDPEIAAHIDVENLLTKHFAILGSTGVGKSSAVAVMLRAILGARPQTRILLLVAHNEYGRCFGDKANIINERNLKLPFWLFNFDEFTDVIYGGRVSVPEEIEVLAELIPIAKGSYQQMRTTTDRLALKRREARQTAFTVDTPVPYLLQDLLSLIDDRMGKLENRSTRMVYHRLMTRIELLKGDPRYAFMFENANVGGDTMGMLLSQLFRLEPDGRPVTVLQLASLPSEVVDAVVCLISRLAFEFGLWSDGALPLLFVCEEAHRYAAADYAQGFAPARRALARIAKEGRKYGVSLALVTQRPAELDPTIISQCSTLFAMRMVNDQDQTLLRSAVSDAGADLLGFVPSLGTGEVVGFGEGMPLPARFSFLQLDDALLPRSESSVSQFGEIGELDRASFVKSVIDRWRGAMMRQSVTTCLDDVPPPAVQPSQTPVATTVSAIERGLRATAEPPPAPAPPAPGPAVPSYSSPRPW
ncbi:MAG: DUF87 domain-containing protein [Ancalomicrobiaceae bacterium]|nr:DUF87 domain-containing protein [Ancalomicrobiaceae bacterium]